MQNAFKGWDAFPKIGLVVEGQKRFYPLREAVPIFDSGWMRVSDTGEILEQDFSVRRMTPEERIAFQDLTDEYSTSK